MVKIAPSILSADFSILKEEIQALDKAGADLIHIDVMDGHFVPNLTLGPVVVKHLRPHTSLPFDTHLMIINPSQFVEAFAEAGADIITVHPESEPDILRTVQKIRSLGKKAGIAINPGTDCSVLEPLYEEIDLILVMTVNPGFGGQEFIVSQLPKIEIIRGEIDRRKLPIILEVDGGINRETARRVVAAGASVLVSGTGVFSGDYGENIRALRGGDV